jgi:hypothetical protein
MRVFVDHLRAPAYWFVVVSSLFLMSTVKTPPQTSTQAHTDDQQKHYMNQMDAYEQQLEIPQMMGL